MPAARPVKAALAVVLTLPTVAVANLIVVPAASTKANLLALVAVKPKPVMLTVPLVPAMDAPPVIAVIEVPLTPAVIATMLDSETFSVKLVGASSVPLICNTPSDTRVAAQYRVPSAIELIGAGN